MILHKLLSNPALVLVAAGFGLFAVLTVARMGEPASPPTPRPVATVAVPAPPPSAGNVDPTVHARLMTLRERLKTAPEDTTLLLQAARLERDAHQLDAAAEHFERFLALSPRNHQVWLDLANVFASQRRWDDAQRVSESMLEHYPNDPSAMYNLGAIHANQGRHDEARRWWEPVRDGADATLADQAATSLAQLARRPSDQTPRAAVPRPNPHAAQPTAQPLVAHRASGLPSAL